VRHSDERVLNLARSSDLQVRRLLLLDERRNTKHVVAEVQIDGKWIVVDPTYRIIMRDANGRLLTRRDLQNPQLFAQATGVVPGYPAEYSYERFARVRISRLPMVGLGLRRVLDWTIPGWEEKADWSLLLERESFFLSVRFGDGDTLPGVGASSAGMDCGPEIACAALRAEETFPARQCGAVFRAGDAPVACVAFAAFPSFLILLMQKVG